MVISAAISLKYSFLSSSFFLLLVSAREDHNKKLNCMEKSDNTFYFIHIRGVTDEGVSKIQIFAFSFPLL